MRHSPQHVRPASGDHAPLRCCSSTFARSFSSSVRWLAARNWPKDDTKCCAIMGCIARSCRSAPSGSVAQSKRMSFVFVPWCSFHCSTTGTGTNLLGSLGMRATSTGLEGKCFRRELSVGAETSASLATPSTPTIKRHTLSESKIGWSERSLEKCDPSFLTLVIRWAKCSCLRMAVIILESTFGSVF